MNQYPLYISKTVESAGSSTARLDLQLSELISLTEIGERASFYADPPTWYFASTSGITNISFQYRVSLKLF
jgi:hypothetical protein